MPSVVYTKRSEDLSSFGNLFGNCKLYLKLGAATFQVIGALYAQMKL